MSVADFNSRKVIIEKYDRKLSLWDFYTRTVSVQYGQNNVIIAKKIMEYLDTCKTPLLTGWHLDVNHASALLDWALSDWVSQNENMIFSKQIIIEIVISCHKRGKEFEKSYNNEP